MIPNITIFEKEFTPYIIMALIGIFTVGILACRKSRKYNIDDNDTICALLFIAIGVLVGSHLLYAITNIPLIIKIFESIEVIDSFQKVFQVIMIVFGGSVFYGGLFGGLLALIIYTKCTKISTKEFIWLLTPYIPLFHFFGRLGCFLSGCCYGVECSFGFTYHYSMIEAANHVCRFPVQLVEAFCNIVLFFILSFLQKKVNFKNYLLEIYLVSYAVIRFTLEFFRGDAIRGIWFGVSTSQIISIITIVSILIIIIIRTIKSNPNKKLKT